MTLGEEAATGCTEDRAGTPDGESGGHPRPSSHLSQQDDPLHVGGVQDSAVQMLAPERLPHEHLQLLHQLTPLGLVAHQPAEVQPAAGAKSLFSLVGRKKGVWARPEAGALRAPSALETGIQCF